MRLIFATMETLLAIGFAGASLACLQESWLEYHEDSFGRRMSLVYLYGFLFCICLIFAGILFADVIIEFRHAIL